MKLNKRTCIAMVAVTLCALMIIGTFAWTNFNAQVTNLFFGVGGGNPGGTLHYDFEPNGSDKEVYIENWGVEDLFVRIRLSEYMEMGLGAGLKAEYDPETGELVSNPLNLAQPLISGAELNDTDTWQISVLKDDMSNENTDDLGFQKYWQWNMGGQKFFFPADETERIDKGFISNHSPAGLTESCINDYGVQTRLTRNAQVLSMAQWIYDGSRIGDYWVVDIDGWAYWASPLRPGEATGLLLNSVTRIEVPEQDYYYGIFAEAQMATKTGAEINGYSNNYERFGDTERGGWTTYGQALMEMIIHGEHASISADSESDSTESRTTDFTYELTLEDFQLLSELTESNEPQFIIQYKNVEEAQLTLNSVLSYSRELITGDELSYTQSIFTVEDTFSEVGVSTIRVNDESNIQKVMTLFQQDSNVRLVELNHRVSLVEEPNLDIHELMPDDVPTLEQIPSVRFFGLQWALRNTGQEINHSVGVPGVDINILPIYEANYNPSEVVVAIIANSFDTSFSTLRGRMLPGYDFVDNTENMREVVELYANGTALATIVGGGDENIIGVAQNARMIPIRIYDPYGDTNWATIIEGLNFAIGNHARIVLCKWSDPVPSAAIRNIMADNPNILFVANAGDNASDSPRFPGAYNLNNVINVNSINNLGQLSLNSNYGPAVDLAAPGRAIAAASHGIIRHINGTYASNAIVTGAAAIYWGMFPDASPSEIRQVFMASVTENPNTRTRAQGHLNIGAAIEMGRALREPIVSPTASPAPTVPPTASPAPTVSPTASPVPTVSPTASPVPTVSPTTPTVPPTASPAPTVSPTASPAPTVSPTASPAPTVSPTASPAPTVPPTASPAPTVPPTASPAPTVSPTASPAPTVPPTASPAPTVPPTASPAPTVPPSDDFDASTTQVFLSYYASTRDITITSDEEWIASSSASWLRVSPHTGSGNGSITITASPNHNTIFNRAATINLTSASQNITINVTQELWDVPLRSTVSRTAFRWHFLTAPPNTSWTASSDSPWITISPSSGTGDERIMLIIAENATQSYRRSIVTITSGGEDRLFTVTQTDMEHGTGPHPVP